MKILLRLTKPLPALCLLLTTATATAANRTAPEKPAEVGAAEGLTFGGRLAGSSVYRAARELAQEKDLASGIRKFAESPAASPELKGGLTALLKSAEAPKAHPAAKLVPGKAREEEVAAATALRKALTPDQAKLQDEAEGKEVYMAQPTRAGNVRIFGEYRPGLFVRAVNMETNAETSVTKANEWGTVELAVQAKAGERIQLRVFETAEAVKANDPFLVQGFHVLPPGVPMGISREGIFYAHPRMFWQLRDQPAPGAKGPPVAAAPKRDKDGKYDHFQDLLFSSAQLDWRDGHESYAEVYLPDLGGQGYARVTNVRLSAGLSPREALEKGTAVLEGGYGRPVRVPAVAGDKLQVEIGWEGSGGPGEERTFVVPPAGPNPIKIEGNDFFAPVPG